MLYDLLILAQIDSIYLPDRCPSVKFQVKNFDIIVTARLWPRADIRTKTAHHRE